MRITRKTYSQEEMEIFISKLKQMPTAFTLLPEQVMQITRYALERKKEPASLEYDRHLENEGTDSFYSEVMSCIISASLFGSSEVTIRNISLATLPQSSIDYGSGLLVEMGYTLSDTEAGLEISWRKS